MGWFSDALFGKKKRINQNKINSHMEPYNNMANEQERIAREMMDPNSPLNQRQRMQMRRENFDMLGQQNQMAMQNAYMTNLSPAQMMAQQQKANNQSQGLLGQSMGNMFQNQYQSGLANLQGVMQHRKGEGERLAQAHINEVNAHNARRNANMQMTAGLVGSALGFAGNFVKPGG